MAAEKLRRSAVRFRDLVREGPEAVGPVSKPVEIAAEMVSFVALLLSVVTGATLGVFSRPGRKTPGERAPLSLRECEHMKDSAPQSSRPPADFAQIPRPYTIK